MSAGRFIALEGGEGTGKSTQARLLGEALRQRGLEAVVTREPGGTEGAEAIRQLLLQPPGEGWGPRAEALLFAAARSDHVEKLIRPALKRGAWVICDRFVDSSRAYQGGAGALGDDAIVALHSVGSEGLRPDLTVLIEVVPETVASRLTARDGGESDAIGGRSADYHASVARSFRHLAERDPAGFVQIDGNGSAEQVHQRILSAIDTLTEKGTD
ncbi:dTMP kinase [Parerythrobacter jejuensis]|uniref:Thymidylate kinase n=1 Tax=Parerythrobacter jejuensis TaxID=795812 RepID=A0A845ASN5_9SPHN|nr:dTMP kinase [Parerythrobacter jejuensis]MXP32377.1 dTMP kinase [Parerythrobacter jejuensis]